MDQHSLHSYVDDSSSYEILATKSAKPAAALSSNSSSGLHFALQYDSHPFITASSDYASHVGHLNFHPAMARQHDHPLEANWARDRTPSTFASQSHSLHCPPDLDPSTYQQHLNSRHSLHLLESSYDYQSTFLPYDLFPPSTNSNLAISSSTTSGSLSCDDSASFETSLPPSTLESLRPSQPGINEAMMAPSQCSIPRPHQSLNRFAPDNTAFPTSTKTDQQLDQVYTQQRPQQTLPIQPLGFSQRTYPSMSRALPSESRPFHSTNQVPYLKLSTNSTNRLSSSNSPPSVLVSFTVPNSSTHSTLLEGYATHTSPLPSANRVAPLQSTFRSPSPEGNDEFVEASDEPDRDVGRSNKRSRAGEDALEGAEDDEEPGKHNYWGLGKEAYMSLSAAKKKQLRNKLGARRFRERRKGYIQELEAKIHERDELLQVVREKCELNTKLVKDLRHQLSAYDTS